MHVVAISQTATITNSVLFINGAVMIILLLVPDCSHAAAFSHHRLDDSVSAEVQALFCGDDMIAVVTRDCIKKDDVNTCALALLQISSDLVTSVIKPSTESKLLRRMQPVLRQ